MGFPFTVCLVKTVLTNYFAKGTVLCSCMKANCLPKARSTSLFPMQTYYVNHQPSATTSGSRSTTPTMFTTVTKPTSCNWTQQVSLCPVATLQSSPADSEFQKTKQSRCREQSMHSTIRCWQPRAQQTDHGGWSSVPMTLWCTTCTMIHHTTRSKFLWETRTHTAFIVVSVPHRIGSLLCDARPVPLEILLKTIPVIRQRLFIWFGSTPSRRPRKGPFAQCNPERRRTGFWMRGVSSNQFHVNTTITTCASN
eukprot:PhF_6_TR40784/c2_g1_i6/m.61570